MVRNANGQQANLHWPHLNHGPLGSAILLAEMWLCMAVAIDLEGKNSIHSFIIGSLRFLLPSRVRAVVKDRPQDDCVGSRQA